MWKRALRLGKAPALAEWDAERASEGMYPVQGQQGVWLKEYGRALFFWDDTVIEVLFGEEAPPDPAFYDTARACTENR